MPLLFLGILRPGLAGLPLRGRFIRDWIAPRASILLTSWVSFARHHFGQFGACRAGRLQHRGILTLFLARHGFPYVGRMSGHVGRARLHGDIRRDGWKGMGRMRPVGGMGDTRRTGRPIPWRLAFPGVHARPAVSIRGRCGGLDASGRPS